MRKKGKAGRPRKCTPSVLRKVKELASIGLNQNEIAKCVGVTPKTLIEWKHSNVNFVNAISLGEAKGIERQLKIVVKAAKIGTWQAAAWWLERMYRDRFSLRTELTGARGGPVAVKEVDITPLRNLSTRALERLAAEAKAEDDKEAAGNGQES